MSSPNKNIKDIPLIEGVRVYLFFSRITISNHDQCWNFGKSTRGYGKFSINGKSFLAHRFSFSIFNGEIKPGFFIDHICKNTRCVNPEHLRQVTPDINVLENSNSIPSSYKKRTHCKNGHLFNNQDFSKTRGRICRVCKAILDKKRRGSK